MKRFLIIGDANVDVIVRGLPSEPISGKELQCNDISMVLGGSSANCASSLAGLGASVDFWGKVGRDGLGDYAVGELKRRGINTSRIIQDPSIRTGACVSLSYQSDRALLSFMGSIAALELTDIPLDLIQHYDHLHSSSIFIQHGLRPGFIELYRRAKESGLSTSLDSGWDPAERWQVDIENLLRNVDIFLPNEHEALHITNTDNVEDAAKILNQYAETVVIKRGEGGALARQGKKILRMHVFQVEVIDTTGAGDCFNAGFLFAKINQDLDLHDALIFANACGALAVTRLGGSYNSISADVVNRFIQESTISMERSIKP